MAHADADAERRRVEPARQKRDRSEPDIPTGDDGEHRGQQAQPCRHLARGKHVPEDPCRVAEASEGSASASAIQ